MGEIPLRVPKLRRGTYFPGFLETRRQAEQVEQAEQALLAVVQAAYIESVAGTWWVESQPGRGTRIVVDVPLRRSGDGA